jgi:hypothetical protein
LLFFREGVSTEAAAYLPVTAKNLPRHRRFLMEVA